MKKLIYLIVVSLILGLVLTGCSLLSNISQVPATDQSGITYLTKGTETDPEPFPLYAGQDWLVGEVLVWDDGEQLCVKYQLDPSIFADGWGITETHLAIATSLSGIPKNKSGNPVPGHFLYGDDDLGGVEFYEECISFDDLDVDCNDNLVIAAHAVVQKCETESFTFNPPLTWTRSSESSVAVYPGYGAQWTKEDGFAILLDPLVEVWDGGTLSQYFTGYSTRSDISWASWICTQNQSGKSLTGTDLRRFNATFDIPAGYNVTGGTLGSVNSGYEDVIPMNDNIYIFMNEELVFWGGTISLAGLDPGRDTFLGVARRDTEPQDKSLFPETDGWHMNGTFPAVPSGLFVEGANNLDVFAEELWTGGGMHELGLTLQVEQTTCESETAWGAGTRFVEKGNWATYFTYTVECPVCLGCPDILDQSDNIEVLASPPADVSVNALVSTEKIRVWKEFEGVLEQVLYYDLDEGRSAKSDGPNPSDLAIAAGVPICIYYVHYDQVGDTYTPAGGINASITFGDNILGLIISGGIKGTFADRDLMFAADDLVGYSGTTYPDILDTNDHARGFDVNWVQNTDDAEFTGNTVDFNVWVANAHDSFRVILPLVTVPCE